MNKDDIIKKLENFDLPEVKLPSHQRRLKMALLARHSLGAGGLNSGYFKKQTTMSLLLKKFVPIGAVAVIALLVVVGVNYFKSSSVNNLSLTPAAYAKEVIAKSEEVLKNKGGAVYVDPNGNVILKEPDADGNIRDEKGNIIFTTDQDGKLVPAPREVPTAAYTFTIESFLGSLEEAKQAKDLNYLGDKILADGKRIKIVQFTDKQGNTTILGIDKDNLPVVRFSFNENFGSGGGVIFQPTDQPIDNSPSANNDGASGVNYGKISNGTPRPNFENQIKYWTENLERPTDFNAIQK